MVHSEYMAHCLAGPGPWQSPLEALQASPIMALTRGAYQQERLSSPGNEGVGSLPIVSDWRGLDPASGRELAVCPVCGQLSVIGWRLNPVTADSSNPDPG